MKSLILCVVMGLTSFSAMASREVQNGGGGWTSDGQYMTFYSAKIPAQRLQLDVSQIPGLTYLLNKVLGMAVSDTVKSRILTQIYPSGDRSYYPIDASKFDPKLKNDLMEKYSRAMNVPEGNVAVYATTDPYSHETILLPDFYKLTEPEQAAILFHESLWILNPGLNYNNVIVAEQAAQAYFEAGSVAKNFGNFYYQLSLLLKDLKLPLAATLEFDRKNGTLFSSPMPNKFLLKDLVGENFLRCSLDSRTDQLRPDMWTAQRCTQGLLANVIMLSMKYPSSMFLKSFIDYLKFERSYVVVSTYRSGYFDINPSFDDYISKIYASVVPVASDGVSASFKLYNEAGKEAGQLIFY